MWYPKTIEITNLKQGNSPITYLINQQKWVWAQTKTLIPNLGKFDPKLTLPGIELQTSSSAPG